MRMYDIIKKKRDGETLTDEEIKYWINGVTDRSIPDYQTAALLMAICYENLTRSELSALTLAIADSGSRADLSMINGVTADKHSTGGVGDKTTLIACPAAAALGIKIAKMSGRGLGHTGGTVDKLESVTGFSSDISADRFIKQVNDIGICLAGHSGDLTPADKRLYALRDVTATVDSLPLIASSIMSKKIASGSKNIVLDVKTGSGALMKTLEESTALAKTMTEIGRAAGRNVCAVITNMDIPLGCAVGNSLEVKEAVEVLRGERGGDIRELSVILASRMMMLAYGGSEEECIREVSNVIDNGSALEKFRETIAAQGGDLSEIDNPEKLVKAAVKEPVISEKTGWISHTDTEKIGIAASLLGAGRTSAADKIDVGAGIVFEKKTGEFVHAGDTIAYLYTNTPGTVSAAAETLRSAVEFSDAPVPEPTLVYDIT